MSRKRKQIDGQLNIFIVFNIYEPKKDKHNAPRYSWEHYGITKQRYRELTDIMRLPEYASLVEKIAQRASEMLAPWIILSIMKKRSYDRIEYTEKLGRIPCGRSDFYGFRRYTFHLMDRELQKMGK